MRVLLVHNPSSGDDDHAREHLMNLLTGAGHQVTYETSKGRWQSGLDNGHEVVAVAGGDGTVGEVARASRWRGIPIAVLPTGTANNIAGWLGLTGIPHEDLVRGWAGAVRAPFDLGVARGPWGRYEFLESVGVGLLAGLMAEIDTGSSGYVNTLDSREARVEAALDVLEQMLAGAHPVPCEIRLDDHVCTGDYLLVEILNFGSAGPNLRLAPHADGGDGRLDVVLVEAHERKWFETRLADIRRDPSRASALRVHHAARVEIRCDRSQLHLDDTLWDADQGTQRITAEAEVEPGALTFLVPPAARRS